MCAECSCRQRLRPRLSLAFCLLLRVKSPASFHGVLPVLFVIHNICSYANRLTTKGYRGLSLVLLLQKSTRFAQTNYHLVQGQILENQSTPSLQVEKRQTPATITQYGIASEIKHGHIHLWLLLLWFLKLPYYKPFSSSCQCLKAVHRPPRRGPGPQNRQIPKSPAPRLPAPLTSRGCGVAGRARSQDGRASCFQKGIVLGHFLRTLCWARFFKVLQLHARVLVSYHRNACLTNRL